MKYKCPYCNKIIESDKPPSTCPKCKKAMIIPDNLRERKFRDRKKDRAKIALAAERERQKIFTPNFGNKRSPTNLFIIMGVLALIGGAIVMQATNNVEAPTGSNLALVIRAQKELTALRIALERFKNDCGRYPTQKEGLNALIFNPNIDGWGGPHSWRYISKIKPDQWRVEYQYSISPDGIPSVYSLGPDRTLGTDDDLYGELPETPPPPPVSSIENESVGVNIQQ